MFNYCALKDVLFACKTLIYWKHKTFLQTGRNYLYQYGDRYSVVGEISSPVLCKIAAPVSPRPPHLELPNLSDNRRPYLTTKKDLKCGLDSTNYALVINQKQRCSYLKPVTIMSTLAHDIQHKEEYLNSQCNVLSFSETKCLSLHSQTSPCSKSSAINFSLTFLKKNYLVWRVPISRRILGAYSLTEFESI
jgi:hypothetical protein